MLDAFTQARRAEDETFQMLMREPLVTVISDVGLQMAAV